MCIVLRKIKSRGGPHPHFALTPCGKCFECRKKEQNAWHFRLKAEISSLPEGEWYGVFFTMTYNEKHLPHIPRALLKYEYKDLKDLPMCFSKAHVRDFCEKIRKYCENLGAVENKAIRYIVCSEMGEHTQRCHYHALFIVPKFIDARQLFKLVNETWTSKGFIFPKKFEGGRDCKGYEHKPFVVASLYKAAQYVSKYISKDMAYMSRLDAEKFKKRVLLKSHGTWKKVFYRYRGQIFEKFILNDDVSKKPDEWLRLSDFLPFHLQSRCLGKTYVEELKKKSDEEILDKLENGHNFKGETVFLPLPRYFVNKLIFNVRYDEKNGKRLVRYVENSFLSRNFRQVFEYKVKRMERRFEPFFRSKKMSLHEFSSHLVANFGACEFYQSSDPAETWIERYSNDYIIENGNEINLYVQPPKIRRIREKCDIDFKYLLDKLNNNETENARIKETNERLVRYISDAFKSNEE